jgi:hypothetical protein
LVLLTRGVLAALLAAMTLIVLTALLATLMLAALMLLILVLVHRCLLEICGISPRPEIEPANVNPVPQVPRMLNLSARSIFLLGLLVG